MSKADSTSTDPGQAMEHSRTSGPKTARAYLIAAAALLLMWPVLTAVGAYSYMNNSRQTIELVAALGQADGRLRAASDATDASPGGSRNFAVRADQEQNVEIFKEVTRGGHFIVLALVIGWVLLGLMGQLVAFRMLKMAKT